LHGPYYYRFWYAGRKRRKKYVKKADFQAVSAGISARKRWDAEIRQMIREVKTDSRRLADLLQVARKLYGV